MSLWSMGGSSFLPGLDSHLPWHEQWGRAWALTLMWWGGWQMVWELQCLELDFLKEVSIILITLIILDSSFSSQPLSPVPMDLQEVTCHLMVSVLVAKSRCTRYTPGLGDSAQSVGYLWLCLCSGPPSHTIGSGSSCLTHVELWREWIPFSPMKLGDLVGVTMWKNCISLWEAL